MAAIEPADGDTSDAELLAAGLGGDSIRSTTAPHELDPDPAVGARLRAAAGS